MYHTCAVQCQIQLRRGQEANHNGRPVRPAPAAHRVELSGPLGRSLGRVQKSNDFLMFKGRLDLAETRRGQPGLAGDCQRIENRSFEEALGVVDEVRRQADIPLETAGENFAFDGLSQGIAGGSDPDAASGELTFDVGDGLAARSDDEPDQVGYRV